MKDRTAILVQVGYMPSEALFYPDMRVSEVIPWISSAVEAPVSAIIPSAARSSSRIT